MQRIVASSPRSRWQSLELVSLTYHAYQDVGTALHESLSMIELVIREPSVVLPDIRKRLVQRLCPLIIRKVASPTAEKTTENGCVGDEKVNRQPKSANIFDRRTEGIAEITRCVHKVSREEGLIRAFRIILSEISNESADVERFRHNGVGLLSASVNQCAIPCQLA